MNVSSVWIKRYGPLQGEFEFDDGLQLVHGPNESGKTLLVEALLGFLLGEGAVRTERIDERPEGYVLVDDANSTHKFEREETLPSYYEETHGYEITPAELQNVFVVRDADLRIEDEDAFYERVTDRIAGIRTRDVRRVKEGLREAGRLTEQRLDISSDDRFDSAGTQVQTARSLREEIGSYLESAKRDDLPDLEAQLLQARTRKRALEVDERTLENARERERYESLRDSVLGIESALKKRRELPDEAAVTDLRQRLTRFDGGRREELVDRAERYTALTKWALVAAVVAFAVFLVVGAPTIALGGPVIGIGAAGYFASRMHRTSRRVAAIGAERESILQAAHRLDAPVDDPRDVRRELERIDRERASLNETISRELGVLAEQLDVTVDDPQTAVRRAEEKLERIEVALDEGDEREFSRAELESVREKLETTTETIEDLESRLREHRRTLREFADRARSLSFRTFTGESLSLQVNGLEALDALDERLEEFVRSIERDATVSRTAHRVFESIEAHETEKVSTLFEGESRAGELFARITEGRYEGVRYDPAAHQILVERSTGQEFTPAELSNGTRDQLYLCIRVALARQLPNVETGFFVMDDAFLAADDARLEAQSEVIAELVNAGWQVIYLSAKRETIAVLESHADGDVIELNPLP